MSRGALSLLSAQMLGLKAAGGNDVSDGEWANLSYFATVFIFQVPRTDRLCRTDRDCEKGAWTEQSHGTWFFVVLFFLQDNSSSSGLRCKSA